MYYLFLIIVGTGGGITTQSIPVDTKTSCEAKMKVFDDSHITFDGMINAKVRAFCIKSK